MPKPYPREFREDVVALARRREDGVSINQIATDFGISETRLNWLRRADIEEGNRPGVTPSKLAELRELRKRNRLLKQWTRTRMIPSSCIGCSRRTRCCDARRRI